MLENVRTSVFSTFKNPDCTSHSKSYLDLFEISVERK